MGAMLLFWAVYGAWMVFIWGGLSWLFLGISSDLVRWVTQEDYSFQKYHEHMEKFVCYNSSTAFLFFAGVIVQVIYIGNYAVDTWVGVEDIPSYHDISVNVAEWVSTTLYTPLLVTISVVGVLFILKKGYPLFKKIKTLTDNLK